MSFLRNGQRQFNLAKLFDLIKNKTILAHLAFSIGSRPNKAAFINTHCPVMKESIQNSTP